MLPRRFLDLWLPALTAALGSVVAFALSSHFEAEQRGQIRSSAESIATESRDAIHERLVRQRAAARDLATQWARFGRSPLPEWHLEAQHLMKNVGGFLWIAWVSLDGAALRVARAPGAREAVALDEAEAVAHAGAPAVAGPLQRPDGSFAFRLYEPVPRQAGAAGVLVAMVELEGLLAEILERSAPGYAISIFWSGQQVVGRGQPADSGDLDWWSSEGEVRFPPDAVWRVVHAPTRQLAQTLHSLSPRILLLGGLVLAAGAAVIVYQLLRARRNARSLAAANRALDVRVREAQESEDSLRRLGEVLEQRVQSRTRQLEDTLSELEALNFSVSHDLRSPIGAVLNFVAILEEEHGPELAAAGREITSRIRGSAERAMNLLEGLLKLSRAGRAELAIEDLDMTALAREAFAQACSATSEEGKVEFVLGPLPPTRGDRALIGSVFLNLLGNALKYTRGREGRRVELSGYTNDGENVYVVSDNGMGFDGRFASKLFGAFERLHPPERFEGAGVGLAIVARIVQRHGGQAWAEGTPEHGAQFFFSLPTAGRSRW